MEFFQSKPSNSHYSHINYVLLPFKKKLHNTLLKHHFDLAYIDKYPFPFIVSALGRVVCSEVKLILVLSHSSLFDSFIDGFQCSSIHSSQYPLLFYLLNLYFPYQIDIYYNRRQFIIISLIDISLSQHIYSNQIK